MNNPEIFYQKSKRTINSFYTTYLRFLSQNSLPLSHIKAHDKFPMSLVKTLNKMNSDDLLLLDPTIPVYARTLQTYYDSEIAELYLQSADSYFLYSNMRQYTMFGLQHLIENSLIVGIKSFVNNLDSSIVRTIKSDDMLVYYKAKQNKSTKLLKIYKKYF